MQHVGQPSASLWRWSILAAGLAVVAGGNTLVNELTYDDIPVIKSNPVVTGAAPFADIWTCDYWVHLHGWNPQRDLLYRPLTLTTFRLNHMLGGANPFGYHLVNVLLHAAVTALVVLVAARIGCPPPVPAIGGALFAVMPIHVEAVAGVVGRAELLAAFFTLSAVYVALRGTHASRRGACLSSAIISLLMFAAMLSKESGVAALVLVPLLAGGMGRASDIPSVPRSLGPLVPSILAAALYLPLRYHALGGRLTMATIPSPIVNVLSGAPHAERFWGAWQLLGLYVAKTFWPAKLCMDYSYDAVGLADSPLNVHVLLGLATFSALLAGAVFWWKRGQRGLAAACLAVVISYLPVSNTFFLLKTFFAERVWYLPSAFGAMVVAAAVAHGTRAIRPRPRTAPTVAASAALLIVIVAGLARSWVRSADWRDNAALFESAYRVHPTSAVVLYSYGRHLFLGADPRGIELLERSVGMAPGLTDAHVQLGRVYLRQGEYASALEHLRAAAAQKPNYPDLQVLLQYASSRVDPQSASDDLSPLLRHCETLIQSGDIRKALEEFNAAAERFDGRPEFHSARAVALMIGGLRDDAIAAYRRSLTLERDQPAVLAELAMALLDRNVPGDIDETAEVLEQAYRLAPDHTQVLIARAELLALQGHEEEAAAVFRKLIASLPPGEMRSSLQARLDDLAKK